MATQLIQKKQVVEEILTGLTINEKRYGYKVCPCRLAAGKYQLDCDIFARVPIVFRMLKRTAGVIVHYLLSDRYVSGDTSVPQYVPDSRERSAVGEKRAVSVKQKKFPSSSWSTWNPA